MIFLRRKTTVPTFPWSAWRRELVAKAFLGKRPKGMLINHKDTNKRNNAVSNLEYTTPAENTQHAYDHGVAKAKRGSDHSGSKLTELDAANIKMMAKHGYTQTFLAKQFGVSRKLIYNIVTGKAWAHV